LPFLVSRVYGYQHADENCRLAYSSQMYS